MDGVNTRPGAVPGTEILPAEMPLAMPTQDFRLASRVDRVPPPTGWWRRALVLGGAVLLTVLATTEMSGVLQLARWTVTGVVMTSLFAFLFLWIALAFTNAIAGFLSILAGGRGTLAVPPMRAPASRTALLLPIYNEPVEPVAAALAAMRGSLERHGVAGDFDIYILSDSTDAARRERELAVFTAMMALGGPRLFYRHRHDNHAKKAGNIAEWIGRFGAGYPQFLILDADSLMEGETLLRLVAAMEDNPDLGLLQSLPALHGGETLFARLQQFAGVVYGPVIAQGLAWWHGSENNYWGHNAMIRTRAFAEAAGLPELPGRKPFGGHIMSHDFVEAALLRRAGWGVQLAALLPGSYEQGPPTLPDLAVRDRRWCQGNIQHAAIIGAAGLHPLSRLHMLTGIVAYASAPLWLLFMLLGLAVSLQTRFLRPEYFPEAKTLFPQWPIFDAERAVWLFGATVVVLLTPKLLGALAFMASASVRGVMARLRLLAGVMFEILCAALLSPITMLTQSVQCVSVLRGADSGWAAQRRAGAGIGLGEAFRLYRLQLVLGIVLAALAYSIAPRLLLWMLPVIAGLVLAPWLVMATSSPRLGLALRRLGLLAVPSETMPGPILRGPATDRPLASPQRALVLAA